MTLPEVIIYTDGACSGNPGPGGWGVYMIYQDHKKKIYGHECNTTNNRMEMMAAIKGIEALNKKCHVQIFTDSIYLQKGITEWIYNWLKNNWRGSDKKLVKNADLWQNLYDLVQQHEIKWHWVKGHANNHGNVIADELACLGRDEAKELSDDIMRQYDNN